jgi:hypothetical protein
MLEALSIKLWLHVTFHAAFNQVLATQPTTLAIASASSATHTGSSFIALAILSQLPYLFSRASCHSSVAASLYNHFKVSYGLVIHLIVAVNVFSALEGKFHTNLMTFGFVSHFNISSAQIKLSPRFAFCEISQSINHSSV